MKLPVIAVSWIISVFLW